MCGKHLCWILFYFLSFDHCFANYRYIYLSSRSDGQAITSHIIKSMQTYSEIGCSRNCLNNEGCKAISFGCRNMEANGWGICDLISEDGGTPYSVAVDPAMCTMAVIDRYPAGLWSNVNQPIISTVTTDAMTSVNFQQTTASKIRVVDMIDRLQNICTSNSQSDLAVITTEAVYFYDDKDSLTSGSCRSMPYSTLFSGFGDLPDITHWKAVLTVSQSYIDVYTDTKVFRWGISSQSLHVMSGYPKSRAAYLNNIKGSGSTVPYIPTDPTWAVHRETLGSLDIYFYESSNNWFNLYSNQPPGELSFAKSDNTPLNQNGWAFNPWTDLPPKTVALTAQDHLRIDFVGITEDFDVFYYDVTDQFLMSSDPIVTIQKLVF